MNPTVHQLRDHQPIERRLRLEPEVVERLVIGESREPQPSLRAAFLTVEQFQLTQLQQERQVIDVLLGTTGGQLLTLVVHRRQPQ